jgi:hypothetical protein
LPVFWLCRLLGIAHVDASTIARRAEQEQIMEVGDGFWKTIKLQKATRERLSGHRQ